MQNERNNTMAARYTAGETMAAIAATYCLSVTRVQQILSAMDGLYEQRATPRRGAITPDWLFARTRITQWGCWEWTGSRIQTGYGLVTMGPGRGNMVVPRLAYIMATAEPIPDGIQVCHKCDNPPCCNPAHLFLGTGKENQLDRQRKGRGRGRMGMLRRACVYIAGLHNDPNCACEFCSLLHRHTKNHAA